VSFLVPGRGGEEAVAIAERPATKGRAFAVVGPGVEDMLLVGETGDAASEDLTSDAAWAWVRRPRGTELPSEFVVLQGRRLTWRGRPLLRATAPVRYIAARIRGSELHVEVDADGRCYVDSLGADRLAVSGKSSAGVEIVGAPRSTPLGVR